MAKRTKKLKASGNICKKLKENIGKASGKRARGKALAKYVQSCRTRKRRKRRH